MFDEEKGVELIGSARHLLLNDLQLIKGYLYMSEPWKANMLMDNLTEKLRNQARLSHLYMPKCAFYLITYSWAAHPFRILYEVSGPEKDLSLYDSELNDFFHRLFSILEDQAVDTTENTVQIVFKIKTLASLVHVTFTGRMKDVEEVRKQMDQIDLHQSFHWIEHYIINDTPEQMRWNLCLSIK